MNENLPVVDIHDFELMFAPAFPPREPGLRTKDYIKQKQAVLREYQAELNKLARLTAGGSEINWPKRGILVVNRLAQYEKELCQISV